MGYHEAKKSKVKALEISERRMYVSEQYLMGKSQYAIAEALGVSRQIVQVDIKELHKMYCEAGIANIDLAKTRELMKLDRLEQEAWDSFLLSKGEMSEEIEESEPTVRWEIPKEGQQPTKAVIVPKVTGRKIKKWNQAGDPRYMNVILDCIQKRCLVLGLIKNGKDGGDGGGGNTLIVYNAPPRPGSDGKEVVETTAENVQDEITTGEEKTDG